MANNSKQRPSDHPDPLQCLALDAVRCRPYKSEEQPNDDSYVYI